MQIADEFIFEIFSKPTNLHYIFFVIDFDHQIKMILSMKLMKIKTFMFYLHVKLNEGKHKDTI